MWLLCLTYIIIIYNIIIPYNIGIIYRLRSLRRRPWKHYNNNNIVVDEEAELIGE